MAIQHSERSTISMSFMTFSTRQAKAISWTISTYISKQGRKLDGKITIILEIIIIQSIINQDLKFYFKKLKF